MSVKPIGRLADVSGKDVSISPETHYDDWAITYDNDLLDNYGYCAHKIAVAAFSSQATDKSISIMDVGCGTGLVGVELRSLGYTAIDGLDVSSKMLAEAKKLGIYRKLIHLDAVAADRLVQPAYDAVISVGTFGRGHMGPEGMGRVAAYAKPAAPVVLFMNAEPFTDMNFQAEIDRLIAKRVWQVESIEDHNYMDALERPGKLIVARAGDCVV